MTQQEPKPTTYPVHLKRRVNTTYECAVGDGTHYLSTLIEDTLPKLMERLNECNFTHDMPITITRVERTPYAQGTIRELFNKNTPTT